MSDGVWPALIGVGGTVAGYVISAATQGFRDRFISRAERERRAEDRAIALEDQRHEFQLSTYLELQDALRLLVRTTWLVTEQDRKTATEQGRLFLLPAPLSKDENEARIAFVRLKNRVVNDQLRFALDAVNKVTGYERIRDAKMLTKDELVAQISRDEAALTDAFALADELLGVQLRAEQNRGSSSQS